MAEEHIKKEYPLSDVTARIIAAATQVHRALGPGFNEILYQRALALELPVHNLEFSREVWIDVHYRGTKVRARRVDFVVDEVTVKKVQSGARRRGFRASIVLPESIRVQGRTPAQFRKQDIADQAAGELKGMEPLKH